MADGVRKPIPRAAQVAADAGLPDIRGVAAQVERIMRARDDAEGRKGFRRLGKQRELRDPLDDVKGPWG